MKTNWKSSVFLWKNVHSWLFTAAYIWWHLSENYVVPKTIDSGYIEVLSTRYCTRHNTFHDNTSMQIRTH